MTLARTDPVDRRFLNRDHCFLCGRKLTPTTRTTEHIFPKWLLNRFELWDQRLTLLNGTSLPYRRVRVPCCTLCNGVYLGSLERRVRTAVEGGYDIVRTLPRTVLFQWLTKIFFQILYMEMRLAADVRDPKQGSILTPEFVDNFRLEHVLLNSVRVPVELAGTLPWSIFVFATQCASDNRKNFDFLDSVYEHGIAIRMGDVGIIALLMDGHVQQQVFRDATASIARRVRLHPLQFREIAAKVAYKRQTMNRTPRFITAWNEEAGWFQVVGMSIAGLSTHPLFDAWDNRQYARVLEFYLREFGITYDELLAPPNQTLTFLRQGAGNRYQHIDIEGDSPTTRAVTETRNAARFRSRSAER